jgi:hypothetical protein
LTEKEWLKCQNPDKMLAFLCAEGASERKLRLFGCACCREVWHQMTSQRSRNAVEAAEQYADGDCDRATLQRKQRAAINVCNSLDYCDDTPGYSQSPAAGSVALVDAGRAALRSSSEIRGRTGKGSRGQSHLLRDIFGNPYRPVAVELAWRTDTVLQLAQGIYDERAFDRLPILADALEEAGCTSADMLGHLRGTGPHVRGCWAVDLVLAKE